MEYKIKRLETISEDGVEVRRVLTVEATHNDGSTSEHGKYIPLDTDVNDEAVIMAAELDGVLTEGPEVTVTEVSLKKTSIARADIDQKLAERSAVDEMPVQVETKSIAE